MDDKNIPIKTAKSAKKLLIALQRTSAIVAKKLQDIHAVDGLSTAKLQILHAIENIKNPTISKLARALKSTRQNMASIIHKMKKSQLVELLDNENHKNSKIISISQKGRTALLLATEKTNLLAEKIGKTIDCQDAEIARKVLVNLAIQGEKITIDDRKKL